MDDLRDDVGENGELGVGAEWLRAATDIAVDLGHELKNREESSVRLSMESFDDEVSVRQAAACHQAGSIFKHTDN